METQLLVIGDNHTNFWNGTGQWHGSNTLPGIRSMAIPGGLAWDLVEPVSTSNTRQAAFNAISGAQNEGFAGWLMLSFGTVDCDTFVWRQTQQLGFEESLRRLVDRYVNFILEVQCMHTKVAVWAAIPTAYSSLDESVVGTDAERHLAVLVFNALLQERLKAHEIPLLSIAEELLDADGRMRDDLFIADAALLSQTLMPYALKLVNEHLGLTLDPRELPVVLSEHRLTEYSDASYVQLFDKTWLQLVVPEGAQYFTDLVVSHEVLSQVRSIGVATTWDGRNFEYEEVALEQNPVDSDGLHRIHILRYARKVFIYGQARPLGLDEIELYVRASNLRDSANLDRRSLFELRDRIVATVPKKRHATRFAEPLVEAVSFNAPAPSPAAPPAVEHAFAGQVIFSEPPGTAVVSEVIFSEPPSMAPVAEVIFSAPPGMALFDEAVAQATQFIPTVSSEYAVTVS